MMENIKFETAENQSWILDIKIHFPSMKITQFKTIMKQMGMQYLADFTEWRMRDFDINQFQSYYLFTIQAYQNNILYSKETQGVVSEIDNFIMSYMFASVNQSVTQHFCQWLAKLNENLHFHSIDIFGQNMNNIHELETWFNDAALYIEKKYYPCGTLGSEELLLCLNGTITMEILNHSA